MPRSPPPPPAFAPPSPPGRRRAAHWACALVALSALGAQAGVTQGSTADTAPSAMGGNTRTLDKALGGDLSTGDRNLDLLLESQRRGADRLDEAPVSRPVPDRPGQGRSALQPLPETAAAGPPPPTPPDTAQRFEPTLILPERGQLTHPGLPTPKAARDWGGGTGQAVGGAAGPGGSGGSGGSIYGDSSGLRSAARPLRDWVLEGLDFVKAHLIAIALAGAAIALLVMGLKAYSRRI